MDNTFWTDLSINVLGDIVSAILIGTALWIFKDSFLKLFFSSRLKLIDSHQVISESIHNEKIFQKMELNLTVINKREGRNYAINSMKSTCLVFDKKGNDIEIIELELIPTEKTKLSFPLVFREINSIHKLEFCIRRKDLEKLKNVAGVYYKLSIRFIEINPKDDLIEEIDITDLVRNYSTQRIFAFDTCLKLVKSTEDYYLNHKEEIRKQIEKLGLLEKDEE